MNPLPHTTLVLASGLCALLASTGFAQNAAPADRNAVNTAARPGDMTADSPVTFPKEGALPAKYPPDVKEQSEPAEKDYYLFSSPCRSLAQIAAIQQDMPSGQFKAPPADWTHLRRTRRILTEGGELRILALGDSIVNDTMRSGWVAQLQEAYPKARIQTTVYVRGGGGCQHYREEDRVARYILPHKPDLVYIGGISQKDIESIREVIRQLRAGLPDVEVLLATGTFGTADPRDPEAMANASHSGTGAYGQALKALAAEERCAYLDMTTPWAEYIRSSKLHPHLFYRDVVHANEFGEQILAKIMMSFWSVPAASSAQRVSRYNVVWESPSQDASGVMPIGNGDIAAGVYTVENGDLYLLLAKNDALTYQGDIYKTGRVRIALDPNPFASGRPFCQTLDLPSSSIRIEADGMALRIWADANRPVYHVEIDSPREVTVAVRPEFWQRFDGCDSNCTRSPTQSADSSPGPEPTQDVHLEKDGKMLWYFPVGDRSVHADDLKYYDVESMSAAFPDPFRFNTFGNLLECPTLSLKEGALRGTGTAFDIRIHALTMQAPQAEMWIAAIERQAARPLDVTRDWEQHLAWWADFWDRSWITISDNTLPPEIRERFRGQPSPDGVREEEDGAALVAQSYNMFRYLMACQSRGRVQTKFNGGLFTQQLRLTSAGAMPRPGAVQQPDGAWLTHADDRLWGRRFTYQNQRLLYWPLLASGDFDLMKPFFDYYWNVLPVRRAITKAWFGHDGAYYRENIEPTGGERDCGQDGRPPKTKPGEKYEGWYHDYYFTSGLETVAMMLDYVDYTGDADFRDRVLVPFARDVLLFFDQRYPRGADGKLRLEPAQVVETWWIAVNPAPDVAGLRFCLDGLLALHVGTADDQPRWRKLRSEIPEVFLQTIEGRQAIAPAEKWEKKQNAENGELYPVFPFRCFGLALGTGDVVAWTMKHRSCPDVFSCACWTQDQIHWACAGNAAEAADGLVRRFRIASPMCRFPLYGREGPDSCPDFDHFGAGSVALQRMLVQEAGEKILLLPAWPAEWDADFKLHLAGRTVLCGTVKEGTLTAWDIQPSSRRKDVVVCQTQPGHSLASPVPSNNHPLRAGSDQSGGNRFRGEIARLTMFRGKLPPQTIRELAAGDRGQSVVSPQVVGSWLNPKTGDPLPTRVEDFAGAVSFEAWICPAEQESGRILDKLTPGKNDGFLLDTWSSLSLRLIAGNQQRNFPGVLRPGIWQHVALVLDRGIARVYLDGQLAQ